MQKLHLEYDIFITVNAMKNCALIIFESIYCIVSKICNIILIESKL